MHGLTPEEEMDYWRERARRAEVKLRAAEAVCEAAGRWRDAKWNSGVRRVVAENLRTALDIYRAAKETR